MTNNIEQEIMTAVVKQAIYDYKYILRMIKICKSKGDNDKLNSLFTEKEKIEYFFRDEDFFNLFKMDGNRILKTLKEKHNDA